MELAAENRLLHFRKSSSETPQQMRRWNCPGAPCSQWPRTNLILPKDATGSGQNPGKDNWRTLGLRSTRTSPMETKWWPQFALSELAFRRRCHLRRNRTKPKRQDEFLQTIRLISQHQRLAPRKTGLVRSPNQGRIQNLPLSHYLRRQP